jgi:hypothetical protein
LFFGLFHLASCVTTNPKREFSGYQPVGDGGFARFLQGFDLLKEAAGAGKVELAHEQESRDMFPELEVGAMPPFGNLYGMDVFVDEVYPKTMRFHLTPVLIRS